MRIYTLRSRCCYGVTNRSQLKIEDRIAATSGFAPYKVIRILESEKILLVELLNLLDYVSIFPAHFSLRRPYVNALAG